MKNFPSYIQHDLMDCGPTCLRIVAKYYGRHYSIQTLREKSQISKSGVSLLGIAEAAESIGFRAKGVKISFKKLIETEPYPCIIHWDQNHFVVLYDIKKNDSNWLKLIWGGISTGNFKEKSKKGDFYTDIADSVNLYEVNNEVRFNNESVKISDPGKGLMSYTHEDFRKHWMNNNDEGIILILEPTPLFYQKDEEVSQKYEFRKVFDYFLQHKKLIFQVFVGLILSSFIQVAFPLLTQSIVDVGINQKNYSFIFNILLAQSMLLFGRISIEFIRSWILLYVSTRVNLNILSDFLIKLMKLPLSYFDTKHFGDIMQRINDHHRIESFLTGNTLSVLFSFLNLFVLSIILMMYNKNIFLIFTVSSILYYLWIVLFMNKRKKIDYDRFEVNAKSQSSLVQLVQGMQEIRLASAEQFMRWSWEGLQAKQYHLQIRSLSLSQFQQVGALLINESKNLLITFMTASAVIDDKMTLGVMLAIQQIIGQLNSPVEQLVGFSQSLQDAKISLERLNEIHTLDNEESKSYINEFTNKKSGNIKLLNVNYKYPGAGNDYTLKQLNITIPEGKTTAIVGMSGSGKTTLLKLLLSFYQPDDGAISLGDVPIKSISPKHWRSLCGVVMQDGFIFSDTIARNIAVGVEVLDIDRLNVSIKISNLNQFIDNLPLGIFTKIGAEGNGISQGQKQRILIARAIYKDPKFIFFDEATNALDTTNEASIVNNLNVFFKERTVVIVAHRLSTVRNADQIIVMKDGSVVEIGTHKELLENRLEYWNLVKNQLELGN